MLNIKLVRFEAQDVITASVAAPCNHKWGQVAVSPNGVTAKCGVCGIPGVLGADGSTFVPQK